MIGKILDWTLYLFTGCAGCLLWWWVFIDGTTF